MADLCDTAWEATALHLAAAIAAVQSVPGRGPVWRDGVGYCRVCGEEIPVARVKAVPSSELCIKMC